MKLDAKVLKNGEVTHSSCMPLDPETENIYVTVILAPGGTVTLNISSDVRVAPPAAEVKP